MKPQLHKLPLISDNSFVYQKLSCNYFPKPWHFHEEYELVLIEESRGTKFIGDKVSLFEDKELILIGSNIPHLFRNHEEYYDKTGTLEAKSIFIHFRDDFLGTNFFDVPEMKLVRKLLENSAFALQINGKIKKIVIAKLVEIAEQKPAQRLLSLLEILVRLSESKELTPLLSTAFVTNNRLTKSTNNKKDSDRIHKVFEFIMKNYKHEMYLQEIATLLNMSCVSFSRYFKHHTGKTFSEYVTEIRITHACSLLMQDNESISQISYSSGFENLSNFYRHFKKITGVVPKDYRLRFQKSGV
ncbi:MAG: AraC family transcriptional regulator [Chitinophagaceae bacterium]|nr:MAG: AraC family transcriptional regulator [Chitinophagaceae bacterium]